MVPRSGRVSQPSALVGCIILLHICQGECLWVPSRTKRGGGCVCQIFLNLSIRKEKKKKAEGVMKAMTILRNGGNVRESS